jgi:multimeric flavodoxin WrbA
MKLLALNASPRKKASNTDRLLGPFLEGAEAAGASCDRVYLQEKNIQPCLGCFACWLKTPGECLQKDDMAELLSRVIDADILVCATPLYVCGMSAQLKAFFDRFIPTALPFIELNEDGVCSHPSRHKTPLAGMVLISNCGFYETLHFDALVTHMQAICDVGKTRFYGSLLRPHGEMLAVAEQFMPDAVTAIYDAAREAGGLVAIGQDISPAVAQQVAEPLVTLEEFLESANAYMRSELATAAKETP